MLRTRAGAEEVVGASGASSRTALKYITAQMPIGQWGPAGFAQKTAGVSFPGRGGWYQEGFSVAEVVDYSDPTSGGRVPLMRVWGAEDVPLSEHFQVRDFAARDGAAYARISKDLVDALEQLQAHLGSPVHVNSGYRHPSLNNSLEVGGAGASQHMAGRAADIWVEGRTPIEVAEAALEVLGCGIGLGLGWGFVHVDLRGYRASWASEGAALDEPAFDLWVLERCDEPQEEEALLAESLSECSAAVSSLALVEVYQDEMRALARVQHRRRRRGAVLLDLRSGVPGRDASLEYALSYVLPGSPLASTLELGPLAASAEQNGAFVFVVVGPDGTNEVGFMRYEKDSPSLTKNVSLNRACLDPMLSGSASMPPS